MTTVLSSGAGTKPSFSFRRLIGSFRSSLSVMRRRKPSRLAAAISARFNAVATPRRRQSRPGRRQPVEDLLAEDVQRGVPDHLVAGERDEAQLRPAARLVDLHRPPALERLHADRAGDVPVRLDADGVHLLQTVRFFDTGDDPHSGRRLDLGRLDPLQLERDGLLGADLHEATALEEAARLGVELLDLALEAVLPENACALRELGEHRRSDAAAPLGGHDGNVACRHRRRRLEEPAGNRPCVHARDEVGQLLVRLEVEAEILRGGPRLGRGKPADVDHRVEVGVCLRRRDREL